MIIGIRGRIDPGPQIWIDGLTHPVISTMHADGLTVIEVGAGMAVQRSPIGRTPPPASAARRGSSVVAAKPKRDLVKP